MISVDTKKKELVGHQRNAGRECQPAGRPALVKTHDLVWWAAPVGRAAGIQENERMASSGTRAGVDTETNRMRLRAAGAALVIAGAGLGLRAVVEGDAAKYGGDALYTLLIVALVILVAPWVTA